MAAVSAYTEAAPRTVASPDLRTLEELATAAHARNHVRFDYSDRAGRTSERRVDPYRQVLLGQRWYLLAWDHERRDWRTFRLDRISGFTVQGTTFAPRELPGEDPVSFVQDSAMFPISRHRGVVRFAAPIEQVSQRLAAEAGSLEEIDEGSCRFVTAADSWEWLSITIAMVGVPYTIEGPAELIAFSRDLAQRVAQAAGG